MTKILKKKKKVRHKHGRESCCEPVKSRTGGGSKVDDITTFTPHCVGRHMQHNVASYRWIPVVLLKQRHQLFNCWSPYKCPSTAMTSLDHGSRRYGGWSGGLPWSPDGLLTSSMPTELLKVDFKGATSPHPEPHQPESHDQLFLGFMRCG